MQGMTTRPTCWVRHIETDGGRVGGWAEKQGGEGRSRAGPDGKAHALEARG